MLQNLLMFSAAIIGIGYPLILNILKSSLEKGENTIATIKKNVGEDLEWELSIRDKRSDDDKYRQVLTYYSGTVFEYVKQLWKLRNLQIWFSISAFIPIVIGVVLILFSLESFHHDLLALDWQAWLLLVFLASIGLFYLLIVSYSVVSGRQYKNLYAKDIPGVCLCSIRFRWKEKYSRYWCFDETLFPEVKKYWVGRLDRLKHKRPT